VFEQKKFDAADPPLLIKISSKFAQIPDSLLSFLAESDVSVCNWGVSKPLRTMLWEGLFPCQTQNWSPITDSRL